jgi:hypothetical protein
LIYQGKGQSYERSIHDIYEHFGSYFAQRVMAGKSGWGWFLFVSILLADNWSWINIASNKDKKDVQKSK